MIIQKKILKKVKIPLDFLKYRNSGTKKTLPLFYVTLYFAEKKFSCLTTNLNWFMKADLTGKHKSG